MPILLGFAFLSGLVTIFAPCIWPLLPIVLSASGTGGKKKPLGVTLGLLLSFGLLTLSLSYILKVIPLNPNTLRLVAVVIIGFLGLTLIIPALSAKLEGWVSRLSGKFKINQSSDQDFWSGFVVGLALGVVWTPCAGPILATIATLAATQAVNLSVVLVTTVYIIGVGIPLFLFATLGNRFITGSRKLSKYTGRIQQVFGVIMIVTAILIFTNYDKTIEANLLNKFPSYSDFLIKLESNSKVKEQLSDLKNKKNLEFIDNAQLFNTNYPAPEFAGISNWMNTDQSLTIAGLKGKVVLVDFWTYTCINCIRTLPYVTSWYEKYKDKGFVVVGVHTPEFEFEKDTQNVKNAMAQYKINYPVAQDNEYKTWDAYNNQYWPAEYLVDAKGTVRRTHFGEGEYDQMEEAIQKLLEEKGAQVEESMVDVQDQTPTGRLTPETYLGSRRMDRFASDQSVTPGFHKYTSSNPPTHYFGYQGNWDVQDEYAVARSGSKILFSFFANRVYLVIHPNGSSDSVKVLLDGKVVDQNHAGKDVENGIVKIDEPRLYDLIDLKGQSGEHRLELQFLNDGIEVFAFTFG